MAGNPRYREFLAKVNALGGEAVLLEGVAAGVNLTAMCRELGYSAGMLYKYMRAEEGRSQRFDDARRASADVIADEVMDIADGIDPNERGGPQRAKVRIDARQWLAGMRDRAKYGKDQQPAGQVINIGTLHLTALEAAGAPPDRIEDGTAELLDEPADMAELSAGQ